MKNLLYIAVALLILNSCSTQKITADYDKTVDFTKHKTYSYYGWSEDSDKLLNRFDKERIEAAFADEFEARNIEYVEEGGDIVVSLFLVLDQKTSTTAYTNHYGGGYYGYGSPWGWGGGHSSTTYNEYDYIVGTLVCDVFDGETKKLIWQGVSSGEVDEHPDRRERNIPRKIKALMAKYPVPPTE